MQSIDSMDWMHRLLMWYGKPMRGIEQENSDLDVVVNRKSTRENDHAICSMRTFIYITGIQVDNLITERTGTLETYLWR